MIWTLKKAMYRSHHQVMKAAAKVLPIPVPALLTGPGSVRQLAENISVRGVKKVLVVTDEGLMGLNLLDGLFESLEEKGISHAVFDAVEPNPTIDAVEDGVDAYRREGCDGIIGFGGGSPMDCAKVIGARIANPYLSVRRMKGLFKVVLPIPPFFCVPTTAGTGSEATIVAVIKDASTHEKFAINDLKLVPKIAVLDPLLMVGLPAHVTASTGMDALTHAIEAYIGLNGSPFTDDKALRTTRIVFSHLEGLVRDGSDVDARYQMALASFCGGAAFTRAYVGYVHAIAHAVGGLYGVPHGLANAIILPHVLQFCQVEAQSKLADLAVVAGVGDRHMSEARLAFRFIEAIQQMNERMKIPSTIAELRKKDVSFLAKRAIDEAHPDYPVPRIMTLQQCEALVSGLLPS